VASLQSSSGRPGLALRAGTPRPRVVPTQVLAKDQARPSAWAPLRECRGRAFARHVSATTYDCGDGARRTRVSAVVAWREPGSLQRRARHPRTGIRRATGALCNSEQPRNEPARDDPPGTPRIFELFLRDWAVWLLMMAACDRRRQGSGLLDEGACETSYGRPLQPVAAVRVALHALAQRQGSGSDLASPRASGYARCSRCAGERQPTAAHPGAGARLEA